MKSMILTANIIFYVVFQVMQIRSLCGITILKHHQKWDIIFNLNIGIYIMPYMIYMPHQLMDYGLKAIK